MSVNISFGQTDKLGEIVDRIAEINVVQHEYIGIEFSESDNYKNFKQLKDIATTEELVLLTDNKNATVACYATWALADNNYKDLKTIFQKFILEDREIRDFSGCINMNDYISSSLYHRYWGRMYIKKTLTDKILIELDSIIIYSKTPISWLLIKRALDNRIYVEPYKTQISILAFERENMDAVLYLSTWHKAEYADNIKVALLKYLKEQDFEDSWAKDYYTIVEELFKFNDPEIKKAIIAKMKQDRHWEKEKELFKRLLSNNGIYNIENEWEKQHY
ncbi:MAG: hypothetical protein WC135_00785 [Bacteroidales bacterium]